MEERGREGLTSVVLRVSEMIERALGREIGRGRDVMFHC